eukprot:gb/GEZN01008035.1/.p1 GENE.gb/GEZN01008035.1/~~gb/GEZN01008035.1/.p1  ORF type:complete len:232 (-),score=32.38 gb/GEZN01008035.1/:371-1066(-)
MQTGTSITIAEPSQDNPQRREVRISGPGRGVETALFLIQQIAPNWEQNGGAAGGGAPAAGGAAGGGGRGGGATPAEAAGPQVSTSLMVPTASAGSIIGKGGQVVNHIKSLTGTQIQLLDPDTAQPDERKVNVTGTQVGIEAAVYNIQQRLKPPSTEVSEQLVIPAGVAGAIIGKGGITIKEIKAVSGCNLRLSDTSREATERIVTVTGPTQRIGTAVGMIRDRIRHASLQA